MDSFLIDCGLILFQATFFTGSPTTYFVLVVRYSGKGGGPPKPGIPNGGGGGPPNPGIPGGGGGGGGPPNPGIPGGGGGGGGGPPNPGIPGGGGGGGGGPPPPIIPGGSGGGGGGPPTPGIIGGAIGIEPRKMIGNSFFSHTNEDIEEFKRARTHKSHNLIKPGVGLDDIGTFSVCVSTENDPSIVSLSLESFENVLPGGGGMFSVDVGANTVDPDGSDVDDDCPKISEHCRLMILAVSPSTFEE